MCAVMARDGTVRVVAYLRPELAAKIAVRAAAERRTISGMVGVLLDVDSVVISVNPISPPVAEPPTTESPTSKPARRERPSREAKESKGGMCEHRIPADTFCKRCAG